MPTTNNSSTLSNSLIVLLLCFHLCVMIPSGHMTSVLLSILERDPPLLLSCKFLHFFPLWRVVWELFLIRCEVKGQGCLCVQIVKHSDKFLICENGLYKQTELNWIYIYIIMSPQKQKSFFFDITFSTLSRVSIEVFSMCKLKKNWWIDFHFNAKKRI